MARRVGGRAAQRGRGRLILAAGLVGFVLVATSVIWRRGYGIAESKNVRQLESQRTQLDAQKAVLEAQIRDASSRVRLGPIVEQQLNMHVPNDSQVIILHRPPRRASADPARR